MEEKRKTERKRKRFATRLKIYKGISCTETAGPNIVLCNAGCATGFEKSSLIDLFNEISLEFQPPKFISEKGESHSFLIFRSTENAVSFFNACHGKVKTNKDGTPMYLNYVEDVPTTEVICSHEDPKGLTLLKNFISKHEEKELIELFDWTSEDACNLKYRQVKHYGYEFRYGINDVDLGNPLKEKIPIQCDFLWKRLEEQGLNLGRPDQLTVNKYNPGQGIPSHVDRHSPFGDTILSLSLGSSVVMDWKHHSGINVPVVLPARSMLLMQGEARYDWQHGIQHSFTDPVIEYHADPETQKSVKVITAEKKQRQMRISLTFRWTRSGPCECRFKSLCDSGRASATELDDRAASHLEELHVHQVYEQIAGHFSSTRHTPWPRVVQFVRGAAPGTVVLDLGAGNGKNILPRNDILQIAGERSSGLLSECAAHTLAVPAADCVRLDLLNAGFRDSCADVVICIAVIHHMSTKARRLQAISTIHRLLRSSGKALITVWAKDQTRSNYLSKNKLASENVQVNVNGVNLHVHENRTQFQHKDLLVPWKLKAKSNKLPKTDICKSVNKMSKVDNNMSKTFNHTTKSVNNMSKVDKNISKSVNDTSRIVNNTFKSVNDTSKIENNTSKSVNDTSKIVNNTSKSVNDMAKIENYTSKSVNDMSKIDNNTPKSVDDVSKIDNNTPKSVNDTSKSVNHEKSDESSEKDKLKDTDSTLLRYYHVFEERELEDLCREVGFDVETNFYEEGNWCVVCKKVQ